MNRLLKTRVLVYVAVIIGIMVLGTFIYGQEKPPATDTAAAAGAPGAEAPPPKPQTLWGLYLAGGMFMWPMSMGLVAALTLIFEHFWNIQFVKLVPQKHGGALIEKAKEKNADEIKALCEGKNDIFSTVVSATLDKISHGKDVIEKILGDVGSREILALQRKISWLAIIAVLEPMMGLLGTVAGMIAAFNVIAAGGAGKPALLAKGVSEALITTAWGLIIAVPVMLIQFIFKTKVQRITVALETFATDFVDALAGTAK